MRKKIGIILMGAGAVSLAAALSLLLYNRAEDARAGSSAGAVLPSVIAAAEEARDALPDPDEAVRPGEPETGDGEMPAAEVGGYGYIGYLSIPALGLELPVMSQWDYARLKIAPCRYSGSTETDDLVICAHNYTKHFGPLKELRPGDLVFFTGVDGVTAAYEVVELETLRPTQADALVDSGFALTLFTCTYSGQARVTVRCARTPASRP